MSNAEVRFMIEELVKELTLRLMDERGMNKRSIPYTIQRHIPNY